MAAREPQIEGAVAAVLEAVNASDPAGLGRLVTDEIEIHTARGIRAGRGEAEAWAARTYDHLVRRWTVDEVRVEDGRVLVLGSAEYRWREGDELADSEPAALGMRFEGPLLAELRLLADRSAGESWLARGSD